MYGNTIQLLSVLGPHFWIIFLWLTLQLRFVLVCHCDVFLFHQNYIIYVLSRITLNYGNCGTCELGMEVTL